MATPMTPNQLLTALKAEGLTVKEYSGWARRCRCCPDTGPHNPDGPFIRGWGEVNGGVQHITAGNLGDRTVEEYIRDIILGDPKLATKCQIVTAPNGVVWLVAAGRANHVGGVGAEVREHLVAADFSATDDYDDRFRGNSDDGNSFTYGNEAIAATRMTDDGDEDYIPDDQYDASVMVWAAIARFHGWTGQEIVGHGEVSGTRTKADPNLDMGKFRGDVMARVLAGPGTPAPDPEPEHPSTCPTCGQAWPVTPDPAPEPKPETIDVKVLFLPTAGYNKPDQPGVTDWQKNCTGLRALVTGVKPHVFGTTELSGHEINPMRQDFDDHAGSYQRYGGSDGRFVFEHKLLVEHIAAGKIEAPKSYLLNGDTKQAAWDAFKVDGVALGVIVIHTENNNGVDEETGKNADDLRVDQTKYFVERSRRELALHGVDEEHTIVIGDFNSETWVKDAMVADGWTAIGPGYFTRWDDSARKTFDWGFIKAGTATSTVINHEFGDHTALDITWTVPK